MTPTTHETFQNHLQSAIAINTARMPLYAEMTAGQSLRLSRTLIASEAALLPIATYFDLRARHFWHHHIPIVAEDFRPMIDLPNPHSPPTFHHIAPPHTFDHLTCSLKLIAHQISALSPSPQNYPTIFQEIATLLHTALTHIEALQHKHQAHFAMTLHIIESAGLASLNAIRWADLSQARTIPLSTQLIRLQTRYLHTSLPFDRLAQPLHAKGCAILLNDVPPIPFASRYLQTRHDDSP